MIICPECKKISRINIKGKKIPLVNNFKQDKKLYNNDFYYCDNCDLGFLKYFHPDKKLYNKKYLYRGYQNKSKIKIITKILKKEIKKNISILEIGGGDGYIGKIFGKNIDYLNVDPSSSKGFKTINNTFEKKKMTKKYDLILCINLLAHINNPEKIMKKIKNSSHIKTKIILSVHNGLSQIKQGYLDSIYHEHKYYYSCYSFKKKVSKFFSSLKYYRVPMHGESIVATNLKCKYNLYKRKKSGLNKYKINYSNKKYLNAISKIEKQITLSKKMVWGIGCAPRSIKIIYDLNNKNNKIKYVLEPKNSPKINLFLPKKNIKVIFKDERKIGKKYTVLWLPWHLKPPKIFKNIIWPYH